MIKAFADGGARGNPGPAAYGVFITNDKNEVLAEFGQTIGRATNNVAEYTGVNAIIDWFLANKNVLEHEKEIQVLLDSLLLVSQINGLWKVKNKVLQGYLMALKQKESLLGQKIIYTHIPREKNKRADAMVNKALDNAIVYKR